MKAAAAGGAVQDVDIQKMPVVQAADQQAGCSSKQLKEGDVSEGIDSVENHDADAAANKSLDDGVLVDEIVDEASASSSENDDDEDGNDYSSESDDDYS